MKIGMRQKIAPLFFLYWDVSMERHFSYKWWGFYRKQLKFVNSLYSNDIDICLCSWILWIASTNPTCILYFQVLEVSTQPEENIAGPPTNVEGLALSHNSILVKWDPPLVTNGVITKYRIYYAEVNLLFRFQAWGRIDLFTEVIAFTER